MIRSFYTFLATMAVAGVMLTSDASAFCGFYVAKADTSLFNKASKVVIARNDNKTVISMVSDYQGEPKEFALVIPVPEVLERDQIHVTENAIVDHLDRYTSPRLVEYYDSNPCQQYLMKEMAMSPMADTANRSRAAVQKKSALGVTIEAEYAVDEYTIQILSATQSTGLAAWLTENGYAVPEKAVPILKSYLEKGTRFFVAKVNIKEFNKRGYQYLRPLQIAFESEAFMLPLRLGMVNANGPQELFVFTLTKRGRVEPVNYPLVSIPSGQEIPLFVKNEFPSFYKSMFDAQVKKENMKAVFLEYAWDMAWCDPCAADPLSARELRELGVFWVNDPSRRQGGRQASFRRRTSAQQVYVTRMHVRYDESTFKEDLMFKETGNRANFQGRYVMRHPWKGEDSCEAATHYYKGLPARFEREASVLASLTSWDINEIREKMTKNGQSFSDPKPEKWYKKLWDRE